MLENRANTNAAGGKLCYDYVLQAASFHSRESVVQLLIDKLGRSQRVRRILRQCAAGGFSLQKKVTNLWSCCCLTKEETSMLQADSTASRYIHAALQRCAEPVHAAVAR